MGTRHTLMTSAYVETPNGEKYTAQLCRHFAHKVDVSFEDGICRCRFSCGEALMSPDGTGIAITITAPSAPELSETQDVIERHLVRFAYREDLEAIAWKAVTPLDADRCAAPN